MTPPWWFWRFFLGSRNFRERSRGRWACRRPAGIVEATRTAGGVLVELDVARTSLCLLVDVIDVELERAPGRRIIPVLPLDDVVLTAFARDVLGDPSIDVSRLIETYTEPLL